MSETPLAGVRVLELGAFIAGPFAGQLLGDLGQLDLVEREGSTALERKRRHRDRPPVVEIPDHVGEGDPHVVVEDLTEVRRALHRPDRADRDALELHVADHPGDATVLRRLAVGAQEQLLVAGQVGIARPGLLAGHDEIVPVDHGVRAQ